MSSRPAPPLPRRRPGAESTAARVAAATVAALALAACGSDDAGNFYVENVLEELDDPIMERALVAETYSRSPR